MSSLGVERDASSLTADLRLTKEKIEQLLTVYKSSETDPATHDQSVTASSSILQQTPWNRNERTASRPDTPNQNDWQRVNEMLRQRGMHPISFLQPSDILRMEGVVVLDEMASHSLVTSMFALLVDCDKKQRMIEEWMQTSHADRVALKEEREMNYKFQQEIDELRRQTQTDMMRIQEMESSRLNELQRHGEEIQQMTSSMSAVESRYHQLELKCRRQELTISQMQEKQQKMIDMEAKRHEKHRELLSRSTSFPKGLSESKCLELIGAYETRLERMQEELQFLRKEVSLHNQSQVTRNSSGSSSYMPMFIRLKDAEEQCAALQHTRGLLERENGQLKQQLKKSEEELEGLEVEINHVKLQQRREEHQSKQDDIQSLSLSTCQRHLRAVCNELRVRSVDNALSTLKRLTDEIESARSMEQLIGEIVHLIESPGTPRPTDGPPTVDATDHRLWCELTRRHVLATLQHWVSVLTEKSQEKSEAGELSVIVTHFQKLFHVPSRAGVIPRMSEVCSKLEEISNVMQSIKDLLGLEPRAPSAAVMKKLSSLTETFQRVDGYDRVEKKLEQYEEFIPAFQGLVTKLLSVLGVSSLDDIIPSVEELVSIHRRDDVNSDND